MTKELMEEIKDVLRQVEEKEKIISDIRTELEEKDKVHHEKNREQGRSDKKRYNELESDIISIVREEREKIEELKNKEEEIKKFIDEKQEEIEKKLLNQRKSIENDNSQIRKTNSEMIEALSAKANRVETEIEAIKKKLALAAIPGKLSDTERQKYEIELDNKQDELSSINKILNKRKEIENSYKKETEKSVNEISSEMTLFTKEKFNYENLIKDGHIQTLKEYINIKDFQNKKIEEQEKNQKQENVQKRSEEFVGLWDKYQNNQRKINRIQEKMQTYKDNPALLDELSKEKQSIEERQKELKQKIDDMNKYKLAVKEEKTIKEDPIQWHPDLTQEQIDELKAESIQPGDQEYDQYLMQHGINPNNKVKNEKEVLGIEDKSMGKKAQVIFNIRTGIYTYKDRNNTNMKITAEQLDTKTKEEVSKNFGLDKKQSKKLDWSLYSIFLQMDKVNGTKKSEEYIKAFKEQDKEKMPAELTYDIRNKDSYGDKETDKIGKKLSFRDKLRMKRVARYHKKIEIADVLEDRTLLKRILLGLGIAGATSALLISAPGGETRDPKGQEIEAETEIDNGKDLEELGITEEQLEQKVMEEMKKFKETDSVLIKSGQEYIEASDLSDSGKRGKFVEDMQCKIANRAIVEQMSDGSERIVATSKGKSWEEAGINLEDYKDGKYVEKYALEAEDDRTDSRGYSVFGWVDAGDCQKLYERKQEINGQEYSIYYREDDIREKVEDDIKENGLSLKDRIKVNASDLQRNTQEQTTQERTTEKEMEM